MLPKSQIEWTAFAAILILAAILRLGAPGVIEFKRDEAALSQLALDMARGENFPLLGISSSVGIPNAPFNIYVMAIPYFFSSDPTLATQFIGLLNVLAVGLTYLLARRYYGVTAAVVAGLTYAVSPWGVIDSRKIWAQDLLPFFILLTLGTGLAGFVEGKKWGQWLHLPLLVITGQIHYAAFVLLPLILYLIVIGRKRWTRAFALSIIPSILLTLPYAIGTLQIVQQNPDAVSRSSLTAEPRAITLTTQTLEYAVLTIAGTDIHSLAGPERFQDYLNSVPNVYPLFYLLAAGVVVSSIWMLIRLWRKRDERTVIDGLLLLWIAIPILAFSVTWTAIYPHYLIPIMPVAYIILGVGAQAIWNQRGNLWRRVFVVGGAILGAIVVLQVWLLVALFSFLYNNATPDGFGTPLAYLLPIRQVILDQHPEQLIVDVGGQAVGFDGEATVWNFLLADVPDVRFIDAVTETYPTENTLYLQFCDGELDDLWRCLFGDRSHESPEVIGFYTLRFSHLLDLSYDIGVPGFEGWYSIVIQPIFPQDRFTPINSDALSFDNGARVFGYTWDNQCLEIFWEITARTNQDYSFAVHFVDADGNGVTNADGLSWQGRYWRAGDRVIRRFCLENPSENISGVDIGMYTYDGTTFNNANLLDANGTPVGQMLNIPFETIP
jgi:4-amino-4-deoxy-L-arabinose transferase-like glycosyltransferase